MVAESTSPAAEGVPIRPVDSAYGCERSGESPTTKGSPSGGGNAPRGASPVDVVELVAAHYNDAYQAAGNDPDKDDIRARQRTAYGRAAARVASLGLPDRAGGYYRNGRESHHERNRAAATDRISRSDALSEWPVREVTELYEQAVAGHRAAGRDVAAASAAALLARCLSVLGRMADGISVLRRAVEVLAANQEVAAEAGSPRHSGGVVCLRDD